MYRMPNIALAQLPTHTDVNLIIPIQHPYLLISLRISTQIDGILDTVQLRVLSRVVDGAGVEPVLVKDVDADVGVVATEGEGGLDHAGIVGGDADGEGDAAFIEGGFVRVWGEGTVDWGDGEEEEISAAGGVELVDVCVNGWRWPSLIWECAHLLKRFCVCIEDITDR